MKPYYEADGITLYHGDCREVTAWLEADVLVTDPPYGMAFVSSWTTRRRPIAGDKDTAVRDAAQVPKASAGRSPHAARHVLVWDKTDGVGPGMGDLAAAFGTSHEEVYLLGEWPKRGPRQGSVLRTAMAMGNPDGLVARSGHPSPKPVSLMERLLAAAPEGAVADPFAGSGSTLVAARNLGRQAIGVEIEERYCEVVASRLSQGDLFGGAA